MIRSALRIESAFFLLVPLGAVVLTMQNGAAQQQSGQQQQGQQQSGQQQQGQQQQGQQQQGQQGAGAASSNGPNSNGNDAGCGGGANNSKPAPLFCGSLRITKARQTGDNTSLGFNGVDPNGQVQKAALSATATADSTKKALGMAAYRPSPVELAGFQKYGGLTMVAPATMQPSVTPPAKKP
jgi:type II secretory pathway pseudopilin PulG